jgi:hypothetical protein
LSLRGNQLLARNGAVPNLRHKKGTWRKEPKVKTVPEVVDLAEWLNRGKAKALSGIPNYKMIISKAGKAESFQAKADA